MRPANPRRDAVIQGLHEKGVPMALIGAKYGISRQRIHQIIERMKKEDSDAELKKCFEEPGKPIFSTYDEKAS